MKFFPSATLNGSSGEHFDYRIVACDSQFACAVALGEPMQVPRCLIEQENRLLASFLRAPNTALRYLGEDGGDALPAEESGTLSTRLAQEAGRHPRAYAYRVLLLALLGYAVILAIILGILFGAFAVPILFLAAIPLFILMLRSLWVRIPAPKGMILESHQAPRLFHTIEHIREILNFPGFDRVLVVGEFNAGISQVPRLGAFGWHRNYLLVGLPLLMALTPEQFRAVLAHEFYHLFGAHSRTERWLYRLRITWNTLVQELDAGRHGVLFLFRRLFRWYVSLLNAHTFALVRQHEYEADRFAADLIGARAIADALVILRVKEAFLSEEFWPGIWRHARETPEPFSDPYAEMHRRLAEPLDPVRAQPWLHVALTEETGTAHSHPSLTDRLAALCESPQLPAALPESAASHYLAASLDRFVKKFSEQWRKDAQQAWHRRFDAVDAARKDLERLDAAARSRPLTEAEAVQRASCLELIEGSGAALPAYLACLKSFPENAAANFGAGQILLERHDAAGIEPLEKAMRGNPDFILPACQLLYAHFAGCGRMGDARVYLQRYRRRQELLQAAQKQRTLLHPKDRFFRHDLQEGEVETIRRRLACCPAVSRAYLVRKQVTVLPEKPHYLLAIDWRLLYPVWSVPRILNRIASEITLSPGTLSIASLSTSHRIRIRVVNVPGACIFRRPWFDRGQEQKHAPAGNAESSRVSEE